MTKLSDLRSSLIEALENVDEERRRADALKAENERLRGTVSELTTALRETRHVLKAELREEQEKNDGLTRDIELLAREMVYRGNSVQHWHAKATAYKKCAGIVSRLKGLLGVSIEDEIERAVAEKIENLTALVKCAMGWSDYTGTDQTEDSWGLRLCCGAKDWEDHKDSCEFAKAIAGGEQS